MSKRVISVEPVGKILIPRGRLVQSHELVVATVLSWAGHDVTFLGDGIIPMPDIEYCGKLWEIKSPVGSSARTIENNLRLALKQSANVIIDLHRIKRPELSCLREIERQVKLVKGMKSLMVITRQNKILEIKG